MSNTLSTASEDEAKLSSFLQPSSTVTAEQAAAIIQRIVTTAVGTPSAISKPIVKLAQQSLQQLFKSPAHSILPHLLPVCERDAPLHLIDAFVLCTAAWKTVTAAALLAARDRSLHVTTALRIILCACRTAMSMFLRASTLAIAAHKRQQPVKSFDEETTTTITRCVKIGKFYCLNAMRCSNAFAPVFSNKYDGNNDNDNDNDHDHDHDHDHDDNDNKKKQALLSDAVANMLRLVAFMTYIFSTQERLLPKPIFNDILKNVAPLLSSTFRSTLVMSLSLSPDASSFQAFLAKSLHTCADSTAFNVDESQRKNDDIHQPPPPPIVDPVLIRLFAILHLMRFSTAPPEASFGSKDNIDISKTQASIRSLFHSVLCPNLFQSLDLAYDSLLILRDSRTRKSLHLPVSDSAAACMAASVKLNSFSTQPQYQLRDALLVEVSARNPLRATVAMDGLVAMYGSWIAANGDDKAGMKLLCSVLICARRAWALRSAHADTRWIPLSARLTKRSLNICGDMLRSVLVFTRAAPSVDRNGDNVSDGSNIDNNMMFMSDAFVLRLMAAICEMISTGCDSAGASDTRNSESDKNAETARLFKAFKLEKTVLQTVVKKGMMESCGDGELCESMLKLVPFIFDGMTASSLLCSFISKQKLSASTFCIALNGIQVSCTQVQCIQDVCKVGSDFVRRYGGYICVSTCKFASRAMASMASNEKGSGCVSELISLCVQTAIRDYDMNHDDAKSAAVRGATLFYASQVDPRSIAAGLSDLVDQTRQHVQEGDGVGNIEQEREAMKLEKMVGRTGLNSGRRICPIIRPKLPSLGQSTNVNVSEAVRAARENITMAMSHYCGGVDHNDDNKAEVESLQTVLSCAAQWTCKM